MDLSRKHAREEDISIRVAAGEPVPAESLVVRTLSSCARVLPADAQEWDVSGMVLGGQPFSRETVSCWLQCGYHAVYGTAATLDADSISQLSTVTGLAQVLEFADAVGSFEGLCKAACSQLQQLKMVVQLPAQTLELPLHCSCGLDSNRQLVWFNLPACRRVGDPPVSAEQVSEVEQQVAKQLAALLRLAHMLRLQPLLDVLHQFILLNMWPGSGRVLCGAMTDVFTDAVLEAAVASSSGLLLTHTGERLSREGYINSVLSQPCNLTPTHVGPSGLLKATGPASFEADSQMLVFNAQLLQDFAGAKAGATIKVELDLFKGSRSRAQMTLQVEGSESFMKLPAQLLLGSSYTNTDAVEAYVADAAAA